MRHVSRNRAVLPQGVWANLNTHSCRRRQANRLYPDWHGWTPSHRVLYPSLEKWHLQTSLSSSPSSSNVWGVCFVLSKACEILVCRLGKVGQTDLLPLQGILFPLLSTVTHCRCVASQLLFLCFSLLLWKACKLCHWLLSFGRWLMSLQQSLCPWRKCYLFSLASSYIFSGSVGMSDCDCITGIICATEPFQQTVGMTGVKSILTGQFPTPLHYLIADIPLCVFL